MCFLCTMEYVLFMVRCAHLEAALMLYNNNASDSLIGLLK